MRSARALSSRSRFSKTTSARGIRHETLPGIARESGLFFLIIFNYLTNHICKERCHTSDALAEPLTTSVEYRRILLCFRYIIHLYVSTLYILPTFISISIVRLILLHRFIIIQHYTYRGIYPIYPITSDYIIVSSVVT